MTLHRATLNRATVNRRQFIRRQFIAATVNRSDRLSRAILSRNTSSGEQSLRMRHRN